MERKHEIVFCYMNPWFSKIGVNCTWRDVSCCRGILGFRKSYTDFFEFPVWLSYYAEQSLLKKYIVWFIFNRFSNYIYVTGHISR